MSMALYTTELKIYAMYKMDQPAASLYRSTYFSQLR